MNFIDKESAKKAYSQYAPEVSSDIESLFVRQGETFDSDSVEIAKTLQSSKSTSEDRDNYHYYNGPEAGEVIDDTPEAPYVYKGPINTQDYVGEKSDKQAEQTTALLMKQDLARQFPDVSQMYIQFNTTNPSALNLAKLLFNLDVKRWYMPLFLYDKDLDGVDPYDPNLSLEMKRKIITESRNNLIYYAREVAKVSVPGTNTGTKMFFHIGSFTCIYLTANNINYYIEQPRQTFKSGTDNVIKGWMWNLACRNSDIGLFANTNDKAKDNLKKTMETLDLLPEYLQFFKYSVKEGPDGSEEYVFNKFYSKTEKAVHGLYKNTLFATTTGQTKDNAAKTGRGKTLVSFNFDEFGFSKFNWLAYTSAIPTFGQASSYAKKLSMPYNFTMTSTPPDATTKEGEWLWKLLNKAPKFSLKVFDMSGDEIREYMKVSGEVNLLFCSFAYNELGFTQEWLEARLRDLGDRHAFDVEIMLKWKRILSHSPFSRRALDLIMVNAKNSKREELWLDGIYKFYTYANFHRCKSEKVVIGVDIGSGSGTGDYSTMVGIDPKTTEILFTFKANQHDTEIFSRIIAKFVREYCPRAVLVVERNGIGEGVVSKLKHLDDLVDNLYYQSDKDSNNSFDIGYESSRKDALYGLQMNSAIRTIMYTEILTTRVNRYKRLFNSEEIADELMSVTIGKNGRYDHLPGQHDDLLMAYMMALYVLYKDMNLDSKFGLTVPAVLDDEAMDYTSLQNFIKKDELEEKMTDEERMRRSILEEALKGNVEKGYMTPEDLFFKRDFETAQFYQKQYAMQGSIKGSRRDINDDDDEMIEAGMSFGNNKRRTNQFMKKDSPF